MEKPSVESLCNALVRGNLVPAEEVRNLYQRWLRESGPAAELEKFTQWLAANQIATEYQIGVVLRGNASQLFLGPYVIQERVGKGKLAGVYRATHRLGQTVAIKVLPPSKAKDPTILTRFRRESRLAMKLKHPNVVRTFQTGKADNLHFLVMELLEGETLHDVLQRRGKLPPAEAVRIVHEALLGLQHIHEQGLVHRDLKPANLMLLPGGGPTSSGDAVKVVDIGTGRALFDEGAGDFHLTNSAEVLGTPEYMAPEQARDAHAADVRSDIYSLGCVLFHALTGRPPYTASNVVRLLVMHSSDPIPSARALNPAVPDGLDQILKWMLAKDPAGRYPTPQRAAQALEVFLSASDQSSKVITDPRMAAYLKWLEAQRANEDEEEEDDPPLATPVEPARPRAPPVKPAAPPPPPSPPRKAAPLAPKRPKAPQPSEEYDVEPVAPQAAPTGGGISQQTLFLILAIVFGVFLIVCAGMIGAAMLLWFRT